MARPEFGWLDAAGADELLVLVALDADTRGAVVGCALAIETV